MRVTVYVKGGALPIGEPFDKTQTGDACHEIHLPRRAQAADDGVHGDAAGGETDVIFFEQLRHGVVTGDIQPNNGGAHLFGMDIRLLLNITFRPLLSP